MNRYRPRLIPFASRALFDLEDVQYSPSQRRSGFIVPTRQSGWRLGRYFCESGSVDVCEKYQQYPSSLDISSVHQRRV